MIIGIDLGTTNCCVAYIDNNGNPQIIPNDQGDRTTPSVIYFDEENHVIVGKSAKEEAGLDPENTVSYIKRQMGENTFKVPINDDLLTPEELSAIILKKLKQDAEEYLGEKVEAAVITVPAYFNDAQRKATQDAANIAGLKVLRIINEPTAAALAYGIGSDSGDQNIMIYDLGGGTFDAVAMELRNGDLTVLATNGSKELGGFDFDNALLSYVIDELEEKYDIDLFDDDHAIEYLREKVEACKKSLSTKSKATIPINYGNIREKMTITQEIFNDLIRDEVKLTCNMLDFTLEDAGLTWDQVEKTIFVGGSSRVKLVREMVEELIGKEPSHELNPDEVVSIGAAILADILKNEDVSDQNVSDIKIIDVNAHSLGLTSHNDNNVLVNSIIINRNTPLPCSVSRTFFTMSDNQTAVNFQVVEGEEEDLEFCTIVSDQTTQLPNSPRPKGSALEFTYSYDVDGIINIDIYDEASGSHMESIQIERKSNLTQQEVETKKEGIQKLTIE